MPLGLFITTKANLLAGKYTFSYSPLVLWWPPLSHFKGKREFFLASLWLQHLFKISYNRPNIGKKALHQGSRQVLLSPIKDTYSSHCAHWRRWGSCGLVGG